MNENFDLDAMLDRINTRTAPAEQEEIPEPGSEGNPWLGVEQTVRGQKRFHAFSGAERRRLIRADARHEAKRRKAGERAYNRQQRRTAFDAGTVRQQLRIISGELEVSEAMKDNLTAHILRQTRLNERAQLADERKENAAKRRSERLWDRGQARIDAGTARHADLVRAGLRPYVAILHTEA